MILLADRDRCVGAGLCSRYAPDLFDSDEEDGLVRVLVAEPVGGQAGRAREAIGFCPVRAIRLTEGD